MQTISKQNPEKTVKEWRTGVAADSPAGPVFSSGAYAQSEITMTSPEILTTHCGTDCTYSQTHYCC